MKTFRYLLSFIFCVLVSTDAQAQLDPTFGDGGKVIFNINGEFDAISVLPNSKIIAVGGCYGGRVMTRYSDSGVLDGSFASFGSRVDSFQANGANSLLIQPDGKILTGGKYLERCLPDGRTDSAFGNNGRLSPVNYSGLKIAISGNRILAGDTYQNEIVLYRYFMDGSTDSSFGINGRVVTNFNGPGYYNSIMIRSLLIQPDGKIIVSGESFVTAINATAFVLVRYHANGSLDTTFNNTGKAYTYVGGGWAIFGRDAKLQPDGKILQCGSGGLGIVLVRYNIDGSLDTSFDHTGIYSITGDQHEAHCMVLDQSGNIITAGVTDSNQCSLYRIKNNGGIDSSFGINGRILTLLDTTPVVNPSRVFALHLYNDGRILVGGYVALGSMAMTPPFLIRYLLNGKPAAIAQPAIANIQSLRVYPNPAEERVSIVPPAVIGELSLTNVAGCILTQKPVTGKPFQLDISGYTPGLYFITIKTTDGQTLHARFLKK